MALGCEWQAHVGLGPPRPAAWRMAERDGSGRVPAPFSAARELCCFLLLAQIIPQAVCKRYGLEIGGEAPRRLPRGGVAPERTRRPGAQGERFDPCFPLSMWQ